MICRNFLAYIISSASILSFSFPTFAHDMSNTRSAQAVLKSLSLVLKGKVSQKEFVHYTNGDGGTVYLAGLIEEHGSKHVCQALSLLATKDLALFTQTFESSDLPNLHCKKALLDKYNAFLSDESTRLYTQQLLISARSEAMNVVARKKPFAGIIRVTNRPARYYASNLQKGIFVLSFDDGPHPTRTVPILNTLDQFGIKALFFPVGRNAKAHPHILKEVAERGHSIGGHTYNHPDLSKLDYNRSIQEVESGFNAVVNAIGFVDPFFRFPYMGVSSGVRSYLTQKNISEFGWGVDSLDWQHRDPETLLYYALQQARSQQRGVILFHDIQPQTVAILPAFIQALVNDGYQFANFE